MLSSAFLEPSKARTISPLNGMTEGLTDELTRSRIPQGFRNELTIFDEVLHQDLVEYRAQHPHLTFLQYVDDVLVAADGQEACMVGTECLLQTLGDLGYRASTKKAQLYRQQLRYLG